MSLSVAKKALRRQLLDRRACLSPAEMACMGRAAQALVIGLELFRSAQTLALYAPTRGETDTADIHRAALAAHKSVCYPRVEQERLRFYRVKSRAELVIGRFGILEPGPESHEIAPEDLDLILLPGVAFDQRGFRLGYGRGFYDRFLAESNFSGVKIGMGYTFQMLDCLPVEGHDQPMDLVVTNQTVYSPSAS